MYMSVKGLERVDREDLFITGKGTTRGHPYKMRMKRCRSDKMLYSFPNRTVVSWNKLEEEVVTAKNVHRFKGKLDNTSPYRVE